MTCPPGRIHLYGFDAEVAVARAHALLGDPFRSLVILERVLAAAEDARWGEAIASAALAIGEVRAGDDPEAASAPIERSVEVSRATGLPGLEWRGCYALAAIFRRTGRAGQAATVEARADEVLDGLAGSLGDAALAARVPPSGRGAVGSPGTELAARSGPDRRVRARARARRGRGGQGRASKTRLKGVSVARRNVVKPASVSNPFQVPSGTCAPRA